MSTRQANTTALLRLWSTLRDLIDQATQAEAAKLRSRSEVADWSAALRTFATHHHSLHNGLDALLTEAIAEERAHRRHVRREAHRVSPLIGVWDAARLDVLSHVARGADQDGMLMASNLFLMRPAAFKAQVLGFMLAGYVRDTDWLTSCRGLNYVLAVNEGRLGIGV